MWLNLSTKLPGIGLLTPFLLALAMAVPAQATVSVALNPGSHIHIYQTNSTLNNDTLIINLAAGDSLFIGDTISIWFDTDSLLDFNGYSPVASFTGSLNGTQQVNYTATDTILPGTISVPLPLKFSASFASVAGTTRIQVQVKDSIYTTTDALIIGNPMITLSSDSAFIQYDATDTVSANKISFTISQDGEAPCVTTGNDIRVKLPLGWQWGSVTTSAVSGASASNISSMGVESSGNVLVLNAGSNFSPNQLIITNAIIKKVSSSSQQPLSLSVLGSGGTSYTSTSTNLYSGTISATISGPRLLAGQPEAENLDITITDNSNLGLLDAGLIFQFTPDAQEVTYSSFNPPAGITLQIVANAGLQVTLNQHFTGSVVLNSGAAKIQPNQTSADTSYFYYSWQLTGSTPGNITNASPVIIGVPTLTLANTRFYCGRPSESVNITITENATYRALEDGESATIEISAEPNWVLQNSGLITIPANYTANNATATITQVIETIGDQAFTTGVPLALTSHGASFESADSLKSGHAGVEIRSDSRFILGMASPDLSLRLVDTDHVGLFEAGDRIKLSPPGSGNLSFDNTSYPTGWSNDSADVKTTYTIPPNFNPPNSDFTFGLVLNNNTVQPGQMGIGVDNDFLELSGTPIQVGDLTLTQSSGPTLFIRGNPGDTVRYSLVQADEIQNFQAGDTLRLKLELGLTWRSFSESGSSYFNTPGIVGNPLTLTVASAPATGSPIEFLAVLDGSNANATPGTITNSVQLSARPNSWHDTLNVPYRVDQVTISLNNGNTTRLWRYQTIPETLVVTVGLTNYPDSLSHRDYYLKFQENDLNTHLSTTVGNFQTIDEERYFHLSNPDTGTFDLTLVPRDVGSTVSPAKLEVYAYRPGSFGSLTPNAQGASTLEIGEPVFTDTTTRNILFINHLGVIQVQQWTISDTAGGARAINQDDDVYLKLTSGILTNYDSSSFAGVVGMLQDSTIYFDLTAANSSVYSLALTLNGTQGMATKEPLQISFDGGIDYQDFGTPALLVDNLAWQVTDTVNEVNRFCAGSGARHPFPAMLLTGNTILNAEDSLTFTLSGGLRWSNGLNTLSVSASSNDSIFISDSVQAGSSASASMGNITLTCSSAGTFAWSLVSAYEIGKPAIGLTGPQNYPVNALAGDNLSWSAPEITLTEDSSGRAWRRGGKIRIKIPENLWQYDTLALPAVDVPNVTPQYVENASVLVLQLPGDATPPDTITVTGLKYTRFDTIVNSKWLDASFDGYSDSENYDYSHQAGSFSTGDPRLDFNRFQTVGMTGTFLLDPLQVKDANSYQNAFNSYDELRLQGSYIDTVLSISSISQPDLSFHSPDTALVDSLSLKLFRGPDSIEIYRLEHHVHVIDPSLTLSSEKAENATFYWFAYDPVNGVSGDSIADFPKITVEQGPVQAWGNASDTLFVQMPAGINLRWWDGVGNYAIQDSGKLLALPLDTTYSDSASLTLADIRVKKGAGSASDSPVKMSLIPRSRQSDGGMYFNTFSPDTLRLITPKILTILFSDTTDGDTTHFVRSDPDFSGLAATFIPDNADSTFSLPSILSENQLLLTLSDSNAINFLPDSVGQISVNLADSVDWRLKFKIQGTSGSGKLRAMLVSPFNDTVEFRIPWTYTVAHPEAFSPGVEFIPESGAGMSHRLKPVTIKGDEFNTMGSEARDTLVIILPDDTPLKFDPTFGGYRTTRPDLIDAMGIQRDPADSLRLLVPLKTSMSLSDSVRISEIPVILTQDVPDTQVTLGFSLPNSKLNPWGVKNWADSYTKHFGFVSLSAFISGANVSTRTIPLISNSWDTMRIDTFRLACSENLKNSITSLQITLPFNSQILFDNQGQITSTLDYSEAVTDTVSALFTDVGLVSTTPNGLNFPSRGRYEMNVRLDLGNQPNNWIDLPGVALIVSAPTFLIHDADLDFRLNVVNDTIRFDTLTITDDPDFPVLKEISNLNVYWRENSSGLQLVQADTSTLSGGYVDSIDTDLTGTIWRIRPYITQSKVKIQLPNIVMRCTASLNTMNLLPELNIQSATIPLLDSIIVADPIVEWVLNDTLVMNYETPLQLPSVRFTEDDSVPLTRYTNRKHLIFTILNQDTALIWDTIHRKFDDTVEEETLDAGASAEHGLKQVDHSGALLTRPGALAVKVRMAVDNNDTLLLDTLKLGLRYPRLPVRPFISGNWLTISLGDTTTILGDTTTILGDTLSLMTASGNDTLLISSAGSQALPKPLVAVENWQPKQWLKIPRAIQVPLDAAQRHWVSQQLALGHKLNMLPVTDNSMETLNTELRLWPFVPTPDSTAKPRFVFNTTQPSGVVSNLLQLADLKDGDSLTFKLYTAFDTTEFRNRTTLNFPAGLSINPEALYYLEIGLTPEGALTVAGENEMIRPSFTLTLPVLADTTAPDSVHHFPLPGLTRDRKPQRVHRQDPFLTIATENLWPLQEGSGLVNLHSGDTLRFLDGFSTAGWPRVQFTRQYTWSNDQDSTTNVTLDASTPYRTAGQSLEMDDYQTLFTSSDSFLLVATDDSTALAWPDSINWLYPPTRLTVVTHIADMAQNTFIDTVAYSVNFKDSAPIAAGAFNYPNPFNAYNGEHTTITWILNQDAEHVELIILDAAGNMVTQFAADNLKAGRHYFNWNGRNLWDDICASGIYFGVISADQSENNYVKLLIKNR